VNRFNLPTSPHTAAFREIVAILKSDARLAQATKTWFLWDGEQTDRLPFGLSLCPTIAIVPGRMTDQFYGPSGFLGQLTLDITVTVGGTRCDDLFDLYHAIQRAIYPADDAARVAIRSALLALGADTGEIEFTQPRLGVAVDDSGPYLVGTGQARLDLRTIDP
jgi:hypothetical protein